ncbi:MAG TPA: dTMP kinase [Bacteroidota bacterium]|jgi:dTMP kinase
MFITFEGLDFSGKTTQANLLIARLRGLLRGQNDRVETLTLFREPGGTRISERIRDLLLDKKSLEMEDITELFLFSASRHQLVSEVIAPALERGEIIVCDRYADSTTAYQGYGRKMDLPLIRSINQAATMGVSPDITILVDIPVEEIVKRKKKAGVPFDRMESFGKVFYERVRKGYYELADAEPTRFCVVDGMAPIQEVQQEIWTTVEPKLLIEK